MMKIMTFNIQHCAMYDDPDRRIDIHAFAKYIKSENPDILSLNEVRGPKDESLWNGNTDDYNAPQARILASLCEMNYYFAPAIEHTENGLYGNALLTKFRIGRSEIFPIPSPPKSERIFKRYENRCLLKSEIFCGSGKITVFVCHMGLNVQERLRAVETVCRELDRTEGKKILMGDFNMSPDNELLVPIFERLSDTAEKICGNGLTYPSDRPEVKIDYVFVSKDFNILSANIPERYISDHRVHTAQVE
jgi:endonuclease/exonuclease/phosphatase family metal-dependent hydrolase